MHNQSWHIHWNKYVVYVKREIRSITITEPKTFFSFLKKNTYTVYSIFLLYTERHCCSIQRYITVAIVMLHWTCSLKYDITIPSCCVIYLHRINIGKLAVVKIYRDRNVNAHFCTPRLWPFTWYVSMKLSRETDELTWFVRFNIQYSILFTCLACSDCVLLFCVC